MTLFSDPPIPYSYTHPSGNRTDVQSNPGGENKRLLHCKQYWYKLKLNKDINNRNTITLYHKLRFLMSFWEVPFAKCSITKLFDPPLVSWTLKGIPFEKWSLFLYSTSHLVNIIIVILCSKWSCLNEPTQREDNDVWVHRNAMTLSVWGINCLYCLFEVHLKKLKSFFQLSSGSLRISSHVKL